VAVGEPPGVAEVESGRSRHEVYVAGRRLNGR
jgi:hypothetical protein